MVMWCRAVGGDGWAHLPPSSWSKIELEEEEQRRKGCPRECALRRTHRSGQDGGHRSIMYEPESPEEVWYRASSMWSAGMPSCRPASANRPIAPLSFVAGSGGKVPYASTLG